MSKTITKLNNLKHPESFMQVNTVKGFKYIDRAGEIVNSYHQKDAPPKFSMSLNALDISEPLDKVSQVRITSQTLWMKFEQIDSLDMVSNLFTKEIGKISKILEVEKVSRIGWRNYFVHEFKNENEQKKYLEKFTVLKNTTPVSMRLDIKTEKDFSASLNIQPVIKNEIEKTWGVLFDLDVFKSDITDITELSKTLRSFRQYLADDSGFLSIINSTFE